MRILLNILAVIIGLMSGFVAVTCSASLVVGAVTTFQGNVPALGIAPGILAITFLAGLAFLGFLIASRAWLHLRRPDAGTARDMIGTAIYLIAMMAVFPLFKTSLIKIPVIIGLYIFHRWLVRRIVARTFPPEAVESHA